MSNADRSRETTGGVLRRARGFAGRTRQRGQALVWFLATAAACCAVLGLVYNVGQATNEKEKIINAADATAMSAALVEARMLNFEAYANRGIVANEVTMAQLVSLDSWMRYDNKLLYYVSVYTAPIPYLDEVTQTLSEASQQVLSATEIAVQVGIKASQAAETALWLARENANALGAVAANDIASDIAKANLSTFGEGGGRFDTIPEMNTPVRTYALLRNETAWFKFTKANTGDDRADAKAVILNSRDAFSTNRPEGKFIHYLNKFLSLPKYALLPYPEIDKTSGKTDLKDFDHWQAQDSADMAIYTFGCDLSWDGVDCGFDDGHYLPVPIGYGRADASAGGGTGKNMCNQPYPFTTMNCTLAVDDDPATYNWTGNLINRNGISNIRDLANRLSSDDGCSTHNGSDGPSLSYLAVVQKSADATLSTQRLGSPGMNTVDVQGPQGSPRLDDNFQNDKLASLAAGCTFFLRPDKNSKDISLGKLGRDDGVHEYASLYNPYWQARLGTVGKLDKAAAYTAMGLNPALALATP